LRGTLLKDNMQHFSVFSLLGRAARHNVGWQPLWRHPEPKREYNIAVVGGGGHGLATAYYLAKEHGQDRIAVIEKGWLGGGNTGRNTTNVRSDYYFPESAKFYDFSLRLYERLARELNFNIMLSQRGWVVLAHSIHDEAMQRRKANAMMLNGIASRFLSRAELAERIPALDLSSNARFPVLSALVQERGGTIRHDAVAWAYARAADARGVDLLQNCEVTGIGRGAGGSFELSTTRGTIRARKVALATAGDTSVLAQMAGVRLPIVSYTLQAMVSEPIKPALDCVVISGSTGVYVNQSDKGELVMGGMLDLFPSYAQRANLPTLERVVAGVLQLFPSFARLRMLRHWGGTVDVVHDSSPIIDQTPIPNLYVNCGFGTGGFKAIPAGGWTYAHLIARNEPHPLSAPFSLRRFASGRLIDESAAAGISH
jgi:sarcosine oxidase, subunit beta